MYQGQHTIHLPRFLSTLSLRRATHWAVNIQRPTAKFLSTLSLRRATPIFGKINTGGRNFYPRSPCGERRPPAPPRARVLYFYPRSPCGERPSITRYFFDTMHFYPRSPCGERPLYPSKYCISIAISIHALLAESDVVRVCEFVRGVSISIHALLAESDQEQHDSASSHQQFLSTLSLRRATLSNHLVKPTKSISIHALLAESD